MSVGRVGEKTRSTSLSYFPDLMEPGRAVSARDQPRREIVSVARSAAYMSADD